MEVAESPGSVSPLLCSPVSPVLLGRCGLRLVHVPISKRDSCVWNLLKTPADTVCVPIEPWTVCLPFFVSHFSFPCITWFLSDQMAQAGFRQSFFAPIYMTDFVPICSLMTGEGMRELREVISVEHRTVLPTAISAQLSPVQHPTGQEQGD